MKNFKELDNLYDWLYEMKEIRNAYGSNGIKMIYQEDLDLGMKIKKSDNEE